MTACRATDIIAFLQDGEELITAQRIGTSALCDRTQEEFNLDEIERIRI